MKTKEINLDESTREDLIKVAKQYIEIVDEINKKEAKKIMMNLKISVIKKIKLFNRSRASLYKKPVIKNNDANNFINKIIIESFKENNEIYGRRRLSVYIKEKTQYWHKRKNFSP